VITLLGGLRNPTIKKGRPAKASLRWIHAH